MIIPFIGNEFTKTLIESFTFMTHAPMDEWGECTVFYLKNSLVVLTLLLVFIDGVGLLQCLAIIPPSG